MQKDRITALPRTTPNAQPLLRLPPLHTQHHLQQIHIHQVPPQHQILRHQNTTHRSTPHRQQISSAWTRKESIAQTQRPQKSNQLQS
jgi:hypothetical protein